MPSERALRAGATVIALAGIGVATYIALAESGGGSPRCLVGGEGCQTVSESRYAELAGINVAAIGILGYASLLAAAVAGGDLARFGGLFVALIGFAFSLYLTYLELFVIEAICTWCVASAALMTVLLAIAATRALAYGGR